MPPIVIRLAAALVGIILHRLIRGLGVTSAEMLAGLLAMAVAGVIGYPIGWVVGHFMARDGDVDTKAYRVTAWANLVSWLVPAIGMALSAVTWHFHRNSQSNERLYARLSCAGCLLAFASAAIGGGISYHERTLAKSPSFVSADRYRFRNGEVEARQHIAAGNGTMLYAYAEGSAPLVFSTPGIVDCDPRIADESVGGSLFVPIPEASLDERRGHTDEERARAQSARTFAAAFNRALFRARKKEILAECPRARLAA